MFRPFAFEFFRNGLLAATLAGALCGAIGCYVVLRGMSSIGHGLSHAVFGGFAFSSVVGMNLFVGAGLWGLGAALLIGRVSRRRIGGDAAIAVVTTASFAIGLALVDVAGTPAKNADAALFGNVLGVGVGDIVGVALVGALTGSVIFLRYRALLFTSFDPAVAAASGVHIGRIDALLMAVLTLAVLVSMNIMGVTLVAAAIVIPAAAARQLTQSFTTMLAAATAIGGTSGFVGMIASYHLDIASGPIIVLTSAAAFVVSYAYEALQHRARSHRHPSSFTSSAAGDVVELPRPDGRSLVLRWVDRVYQHVEPQPTPAHDDAQAVGHLDRRRLARRRRSASFANDATDP